jgi:hypothetical protein
MPDYYTVLAQKIQETRDDPVKMREVVYEAARLALKWQVQEQWPSLSIVQSKSHIRELEDAIARLEADAAGPGGATAVNQLRRASRRPAKPQQLRLESGGGRRSTWSHPHPGAAPSRSAGGAAAVNPKAAGPQASRQSRRTIESGRTTLQSSGTRRRDRALCEPRATRRLQSRVAESHPQARPQSSRRKAAGRPGGRGSREPGAGAQPNPAKPQCDDRIRGQ